MGGTSKEKIFSVPLDRAANATQYYASERVDICCRL